MSIQSTYGLNSIDIDLPTFPTTIVAAKGPTRRVCIQSLIFWPNVWIQSTLTFSDSITGTVIGVINIPTTPPQVGDGSSSIFVVFTPTGTLLSLGAGLNITVSVNGLAGRLHLETYQKGQMFVIPAYVAPQTAGFTK